MSEIKAVVWDLDGTLLNTLIDLRNSVNYSMNKLGYPERTLEEIRCFVGNGVRKLIELSIPNGLENPDYENAYAIFCEHYSVHSLDNTRPYEGVVGVVNSLRELGIKQAIVSNKVDDGVKRLNDTYFNVDVAIGVTDDLPRKPAPDMVEKALMDLGIEKENAIYIGDSEVDLATAHNSGLPCVSVLWGFRSEEEIKKFGPKCLVKKPEEIISLVK